MSASPLILRPITVGAGSDVPHTPAADSLPERPPLGRNVLLIILAVWTVIGLLTSANALLNPLPNRGPFAPVLPYAGVLLNFFNAYLWAALTLQIFWLTNRFTFERTRWLQWLMYVFVGLAVSLFVEMLSDFVRRKLFYIAEPVSEQFLTWLSSRRFFVMNEFFTYVAVVAAGVALNFFQRYRVRREEAVRLQAEAALLQAQLADARLAALRAQLNPHFLFNTLHAVSALVERDPRGVRRMIARLSELLRTSLDEADEPEVSLQRELVFTERYLDVIQIRFQGQVRVDVNVDPDVRDALVPNLILQPLVENAIKHGISKLSGGGHIEVSAHRQGERVVISVRDNGPAADNPAASNIDASSSNNLPISTGVGLHNTRARLAAMYGSDQSLSLRPAAGGGLIAEVSLPYHTQSDLHAQAIPANAVSGAVAID
jgi:signal transduction histidine kinase